MSGRLHEMAEEDYIDLDVGSISFCYSPQTTEFEFQMSSSTVPQTQPITSPADELFYKGQLLPLHLPPRLQMVQKLLLQDPDSTAVEEQQHYYEPADSFPAGRGLNPDEFFSQFGTEKKRNHPLCHKLRASKAYLSSLLTKTGCSYQSMVKNGPISPVSMAKKRNPCGQMERERPQIKRGPESKSSFPSSATCFLSSSTSNSEFESSIQGAIAHCKQSQQSFSGSKTVREVDFCSLSIVAACDSRERAGVCGG